MKKLFYLFVIFIGIAVVTRTLMTKNVYTQSLEPNLCSINIQESWQQIPCSVLQELNLNYIKNIKPIFVNKCQDCHGYSEKLPLYSKIWPVSLLIKDDILEAQEHMDMRADFPFLNEKGHSIVKTLEEIKEVIEENEMPPWIYLFTHWQDSLSKDEKNLILEWVEQANLSLKPYTSPIEDKDNSHQIE